MSGVGNSLGVVGSGLSSISSLLGIVGSGLSGSSSGLIGFVALFAKFSLSLDKTLQLSNNIIDTEFVDAVVDLLDVLVDVVDLTLQVFLQSVNLTLEVTLSLLKSGLCSISTLDLLQTLVDVVDFLFPQLDSINLLLQVLNGSLTSEHLVVNALLESTELLGSLTHVVSKFLVDGSDSGVDFLHLIVEVSNIHLASEQVVGSSPISGP